MTLIDVGGNLIEINGNLVDVGTDPRNPCLDQECFHNMGFGLSVCQTTITVAGIAFPFDTFNGTWVNTVDCSDCSSAEVTGCVWQSDLTTYTWPGFQCCSGGTMPCPGLAGLDGYGADPCNTPSGQRRLTVEYGLKNGINRWFLSNLLGIDYEAAGGLGNTTMTVANIDFGNPFHVFGGWHKCGPPCDRNDTAFAEADYGTVTVNPVWKALC